MDKGLMSTLTAVAGPKNFATVTNAVNLVFKLLPIGVNAGFLSPGVPVRYDRTIISQCAGTRRPKDGPHIKIGTG